MDRPSEIAELVLTTLRESTVPLYARELVDELKTQGQTVDRKSVNDALSGPLAGEVEKLPDRRWVVAEDQTRVSGSHKPNTRRPGRTISPSRAALESGSPSLTAGEWEVLDFFDEQLEAGWEIYVQPYLNGLRPRPDFVLLNEVIGAAVFEVKDWQLADVEYEYCNDRKVKVIRANGQVKWTESPIHQVERHEREMKDLCRGPRLGNTSAPCAWTAGVIFTRGDTVEARGLLGVGPESPDEPSTDAARPVSGSDAIAAGNLSIVFPAATTAGETPMSPEAAADLRAWLVEPRLPAELRAKIHLDSQQAHLAGTRPKKGFRRIWGPAGSGKTLVLCSRAAQIQQADPSSEILLVSFNITLLNYLAELVRHAGGNGNAVARLNFHSWAKRVTNDVGWEHQYKALWTNKKGTDRDEQQQVLDEELAQLVIDALKSPRRRKLTATYDAILVDEGQDFLPLWWSALRKALKPGGEMVLAADFGQGLYKRDSSWTESAMVGAGFSGRWAKLKICYRLPERLRVFVDSYQRDHAGDAYLPLEPPAQTRIETCELFWKDSSAETLVDDAVAAVYELVRNAERLGAGASDVTVLADKEEFGKQIVKRLEKEARYRISHTFGASDKDSRRLKLLFGHRRERNHRISVTTLHSFKGFEAPLLVVVLTNANPRYFYSALSRLGGTIDGMSLIVVCSDPTLNARGSDWPRFTVDPRPRQP